MLELRPFQLSILDKCRNEFLAGKRSIMLYAPTGAGKTEMAISMLQAAADKGKTAAMVLDRVVLCDQTSKRLEKYNIPHGVLQSGHWRYRPGEKIQICSAQTLEARGSFPDIDLLIVDEAHTIRKETAALIKNNPHIRTIGLSASPFTKGLGEIYESVVSAVTTNELVNDGWLCPLKVFVATEIDMDGAKTVMGEWSQKDATERGIKITGDIVAEWVKKTHEIYGGPRKTIVFCAGVAHGEDLAMKFADAGYNFINISYKDDSDFKKDVLGDFEKLDSDIHGLIATDVLSKGFDNPAVEIIVSARPFTKSFSSHVQQLGRGTRQFPDKQFCTLLDHSGNFLRFQKEWDTLCSEGVTTLDEDIEKAKKELDKKEKEAAKCPQCGALWGFSDICNHCGFVRVRRNDVIEVAGVMNELVDVKKEKYSAAYKENFYAELLGYCREKGKKEAFADFKYKDKFGEPKPVSFSNYGKTPSIETSQWVKSRLIAYAQKMGKKK